MNLQVTQTANMAATDFWWIEKMERSDVSAFNLCSTAVAIEKRKREKEKAAVEEELPEKVHLSQGLRNSSVTQKMCCNCTGSDHVNSAFVTLNVTAMRVYNPLIVRHSTLSVNGLSILNVTCIICGIGVYVPNLQERGSAQSKTNLEIALCEVVAQPGVRNFSNGHAYLSNDPAEGHCMNVVAIARSKSETYALKGVARGEGSGKTLTNMSDLLPLAKLFDFSRWGTYGPPHLLTPCGARSHTRHRAFKDSTTTGSSPSGDLHLYLVSLSITKVGGMLRKLRGLPTDENVHDSQNLGFGAAHVVVNHADRDGGQVYGADVTVVKCLAITKGLQRVDIDSRNGQETGEVEPRGSSSLLPDIATLRSGHRHPRSELEEGRGTAEGAPLPSKGLKIRTSENSEVQYTVYSPQLSDRKEAKADARRVRDYVLESHARLRILPNLAKESE
ncbi:hypothetical protein WH47_01673 [Habropoda laboriosa]|uniref:Uncharacterized protein n=1 Tax=Habropoda laboriosa TaxID=597456 RepID=A0A0L7QZR7_9HYME|nr:hypothetical protein WH47_01673 [Habropoda laboriosa]